MSLKQIFFYLKDEVGQLYAITDLLAGEGVNIRAISVAIRPEDQSAVRIVADDPNLAINVLTTHGIEHEVSEVLAVETPDHAGGLNAVLRPLKEGGVNVKYLYPFIGRLGDHAIMILGVDKPDEARAILKKNWINMLGDELYSL
jgi:hypothetical protein